MKGYSKQKCTKPALFFVFCWNVFYFAFLLK